MTIATPLPGTVPGVPVKTLSDCMTDAVMLSGLLRGLGALDNEGHEGNAVTAMIEIAKQRADDIAADLERLAMSPPGADLPEVAVAKSAEPGLAAPRAYLEESPLPADAYAAIKALSWAWPQRPGNLQASEYDRGLDHTITALIDLTEAKVMALIEYTEELERKRVA